MLQTYMYLALPTSTQTNRTCGRKDATDAKTGAARIENGQRSR